MRLSRIVPVVLLGALALVALRPAAGGAQQLSARGLLHDFECLTDRLPAVQASAVGVGPSTPDGLAPGRPAVAPPPGGPATPSGTAPPPTLGSVPDPPPVLLVDVLIVYTPAARVVVGGTAAMGAVAVGHVDYTNDVYATCGVSHRLRLVGTAETPYVENGNLITDLTRLQDPSDGFMDEVHPLRDALGADLVCLIADEPSQGVGYMMDVLSTSFANKAFSAIAADSGGYVFAHETGHNQGLSHNNGPGAPATVFCDAFGHRTGGPEYRTIMSNPPGIRVDFFSSPDLSFDGFPLGVDGTGCPNDAADSVRALNGTAPFVAEFR